ncbi:MAG: VWA domain-containing protein [Flavisolibacter sp.]|jgi:hypothetical protein|nr:VWA domain-containing protein [Flavisolibacter sp.]
MQTTTKWAIALGILSTSFIFYLQQQHQSTLESPQNFAQEDKKHAASFASLNTTSRQKIQVAILLDVSNSMDGLIDQAKAQLWNMVSVLGKTECSSGTPDIEIALYEYGRSSNDEQKGYVKQVNPFTIDLDEVSKNLFGLHTNGGDEYCGEVIYTSINDLKWDTASTNYKVIFIAGNEDFLQGQLHFRKACAAAATKGVIVNTIYCGSRTDAIREHWDLGAECGQGSFTVINQDAREEEIPTPYDQELLTLNTSLNGTYLGYGATGNARKAKLEEVDQMNAERNSMAMKRVKVKGDQKVYKNAEWDLVDAFVADATIIQNVETKTLPDSLQSKTKTELTNIVKAKAVERNHIQKRIAELSVKRDAYLVQARSKNQASTSNTLESEIEKILKLQVQRFQMQIP